MLRPMSLILTLVIAVAIWAAPAQADDGLRDLIMKEASTAVLREEARKRGMRSLRESGLLAIYDGLTTIDEVVRETALDD